MKESQAGVRPKSEAGGTGKETRVTEGMDNQERELRGEECAH